MSIPWILTTPSTRGIGFALTRHLLKTTKAPIVATYRQEGQADELRESLLDGIEVDKDRKLEILRVDVGGS
jgi:NAD(P)-dependent dehydrogenase (short-subunit alcohol dehydrogenase family)